MMEFYVMSLGYRDVPLKGTVGVCLLSILCFLPMRTVCSTMHFSNIAVQGPSLEAQSNDLTHLGLEPLKL